MPPLLQSLSKGLNYLAKVPAGESFVNGVGGTAKNVAKTLFAPHLGKYTNPIRAGLYTGLVGDLGYEGYKNVKDLQQVLGDSADSLERKSRGNTPWAEWTNKSVGKPVYNSINYIRDASNNPLKLLFPSFSSHFRNLPENFQQDLKARKNNLVKRFAQDKLQTWDDNHENNVWDTGLNLMSPARALMWKGIRAGAGSTMGRPMDYTAFSPDDKAVANPNIQNYIDKAKNQFSGMSPEQKNDMVRRSRMIGIIPPVKNNLSSAPTTKYTS